jgi:hypothetical protein
MKADIHASGGDEPTTSVFEQFENSSSLSAANVIGIGNTELPLFIRMHRKLQKPSNSEQLGAHFSCYKKGSVWLLITALTFC